MTDTEPAAATEAELRDQCGHVCLKDSQHVYRREPHFYGYRGGPWSIHGMMDRIDRLEEENERLRDAATLAGEVISILVRALNGNEDTVYAYHEANQLLRDPLFGEADDG